MKKFIQNKLKDQKGLTLIELLAVIVILAIIAAIAIPAIGNIIENSRHGAVKSDFQNAIAAGNLYFTENTGETTADISDLQDDYLDDVGSLVTVTVTKATGGITISGTANANDNTYTVPASGTAALTNAQLSEISNSDFGNFSSAD